MGEEARGTEASSEYTVQAVAARLQLTAEQVHDLIAAGSLTAKGSGDDLRVTPESVVMYMFSRLNQDLARATRRPPGVLEIVEDVALALVLALWYMAFFAELFSLRAGKPIVSLPIAIAFLASLLALAWWLGWRSRDFQSTQGIGTTLYGRRKTESGRVGTKWLIFAGVPLLPVRSYIILEEGEEKPQDWAGMIKSKRYRLAALPGIHWPQALPILLGIWATIATIFVVAIYS